MSSTSPNLQDDVPIRLKNSLPFKGFPDNGKPSFLMEKTRAAHLRDVHFHETLAEIVLDRLVMPLMGVSRAGKIK